MADAMIALKSTLDKLMHEKQAELLADYPNLGASEVDDMAQTDATHKSDNPALIWSLGALYPAPHSPLFGVELMVGAKTTADAGNYDLSRLVDAVTEAFRSGESITLRDYSALDTDPAADVDVGYLYISSSHIEGQEFDRQSGVRYAVVRGKVVIYG